MLGDVYGCAIIESLSKKELDVIEVNKNVIVLLLREIAFYMELFFKWVILARVYNTVIKYACRFCWKMILITESEDEAFASYADPQ